MPVVKMALVVLPPYAIEFILGLTAFIAYYLYVSPFTYWKKRGIVQIDVPPLIGNLLFRMRCPYLQYTQMGYNEFPNDKMVGYYDSWRPTLLIKDPDLIETVLTKDFAHLADRSRQTNPKDFLAKHLLNVPTDQWKSVRSKLNPTFSSSKLKGMHSQLIACGDALMTFMQKYEKGTVFDSRELVQRFSMDVIAMCAFGLNLDTINDPNNVFRTMGLEFFKPSLLVKLEIVFFNGILNKLGLSKMFSKTRRLMGYFANVLDETLEYRKKTNVVRTDFLQLITELMEKDSEAIENKELDPKDPFIFDRDSLMSNAFAFFLAGFETTATTVSYTMYELSLNPQIQDRLYAEVSNVLTKHEGVPNYYAIQEMTYLDQVLDESLRKYPPLYALSRKVTKQYTIPGTNVVLPVGLHVRIPVYSLHHDPKYFPEPERFLPERFEKGKNLIGKGTYLPFGDGPRMCIGGRFAKMESKLCLAMIINKYRLSPCEETQVPVKFKKNSLLLVPEKGLLMTISKR